MNCDDCFFKLLLYLCDIILLTIYIMKNKILFLVSIYDNTLTNFANNTVQNNSFGRYFSIHR